MDELSIITQNLNGIYYNNKYYKDKRGHEKLKGKGYKDIKEYMNLKKANVYAFQELKQGKCNISKILGDVNYKLSGEIRDTEIIWNTAFPWIDYKSGYWDEWDIEFAKKNIKIINFHCSPRYSAQMRYTLLKRLNNLGNKLVVLLGDFNAAFNYQTETPIKDNDKFLTLIVKDLKYTELLKEYEDKNSPHYTHPHYTYKFNNKKKKLDHIFISEGLYKLSDSNWNFLIEYIDDVNKNFSTSKEAFTDHSGIKLTIQS